METKEIDTVIVPSYMYQAYENNDYENMSADEVKMAKDFFYNKYADCQFVGDGEEFYSKYNDVCDDIEGMCVELKVIQTMGLGESTKLNESSSSFVQSEILEIVEKYIDLDNIPSQARQNLMSSIRLIGDDIEELTK